MPYLVTRSGRCVLQGSWVCLAGTRKGCVGWLGRVNFSSTTTEEVVEEPHSETTRQRRTTLVYSCLDTGLLPYCRGWAWQQALVSRRLETQRRLQQTTTNEQHLLQHHHHHHYDDNDDCVLLLQHEPVYTLGRGADEKHLTFLQKHDNEQDRDKLSRRRRGPGTARLCMDKRLDGAILGQQSLSQAVDALSDIATPVMAPNGAYIYRIERGGEVTYHGPGQLVCYPMLDLRREPFQKDLHWYLRMVEQVIIDTLQEYDIEGVRDEINTGVWVEKEKVAAVGVSASRWITTHGFALNVAPDMSFFDTDFILPCGIEDRNVTSMERILTQRGEESRVPSVEEVASVALDKLERVFGIKLDKNTTTHMH